MGGSFEMWSKIDVGVWVVIWYEKSEVIWNEAKVQIWYEVEFFQFGIAQLQMTMNICNFILFYYACQYVFRSWQWYWNDCNDFWGSYSLCVYLEFGGISVGEMCCASQVTNVALLDGLRNSFKLCAKVL